MFVVATAIMINWWLLAVLLTIMFALVGSVGWGNIPLQPGIVAASIMFCLTSLALSPAADRLLLILYRCRQLLSREETRLGPLILTVIQAADVTFHPYQLRIYENLFPNAFALGLKWVIVSRGLLAMCSDEEICGVLAHEIGHICQGHALRQRVFWAVNLIGQTILRLLAWIGQLVSVLTHIPLLRPIGAISRQLLTLLGWSLEILLFLPLVLGQHWGLRQQEHQADLFAAQLGFGGGLLSYLNKLADLEVQPVGGFSLLQLTHPAVRERIRRLEARGLTCP